MSDAARQTLKVSREGIVLIKSFEGFRPRAIQRADGGWIIGYGHTLSAREGASVSEADAELLLRYDLLPVEKTVNETVPEALNQHQFDALVSFAFSVGVDRFTASDVRQRLNAGAPDQAADAIMGWPEPPLPEAALRRRAAERALFVANPSTPVALSDLLSAPLPPPAAPVSPPAAPVEAAPAPEPAAPATLAAVDPRGAAVAALLGDPAARLVQAEAAPQTIIPSFAAATSGEATGEPAPSLAPSNDNPPIDDTAHDAVETASSETPPSPDEAPAAVDRDSLDQAEAMDPTGGETVASPSAPVWAKSRYLPYGLPMVGPLPSLQTAATDQPEIDPASPPAETVESPEIDSVEAQPTPVAAQAPVDEPATELILTPLEDAPEPAVVLPLWTAEERTQTEGSETTLFGEDMALTQGGAPIMRHEIETEAPTKFDWGETGPLIFMGGVGLVSFGASMAAFRRAAEQSGGNELTLIGWVLALIGLACVGVSSVNLYRKFGLPGGD